MHVTCLWGQVCDFTLIFLFVCFSTHYTHLDLVTLSCKSSLSLNHHYHCRANWSHQHHHNSNSLAPHYNHQRLDPSPPPHFSSSSFPKNTFFTSSPPPTTIISFIPTPPLPPLLCENIYFLRVQFQTIQYGSIISNLQTQQWKLISAKLNYFGLRFSHSLHSSHDIIFQLWRKVWRIILDCKLFIIGCVGENRRDILSFSSSLPFNTL